MFENIKPSKSLLADIPSLFVYLHLFALIADGRAGGVRSRLWAYVIRHRSADITEIVLGHGMSRGAVSNKEITSRFIFRSPNV